MCLMTHPVDKKKTEKRAKKNPRIVRRRKVRISSPRKPFPRLINNIFPIISPRTKSPPSDE